MAVKDKEQLAAYLRAAADEIGRGASMEGSIRYEWAEDEPGKYRILAFCRTGNDMGQGGAMVITDDGPWPDSALLERDQAAAEAKEGPDWTVDLETGRSNSSPIFNELVKEVAHLIRNDAHHLIRGHTEVTGQLIMAQLAHKYGLVPYGYQRALELGELINEYVRGESVGAEATRHTLRGFVEFVRERS